MKKLASATGGTVLMSFEEVKPEDLGEAGLVEERKIGGEEMIFVEQCQNPKAVSILLRGGTEHVVDELERSMNDGLRVVACALEDGKYVARGGSAEIELVARQWQGSAQQVDVDPPMVLVVAVFEITLQWLAETEVQMEIGMLLCQSSQTL